MQGAHLLPGAKGFLSGTPYIMGPTVFRALTPLRNTHSKLPISEAKIRSGDDEESPFLGFKGDIRRSSENPSCP